MEKEENLARVCGGAGGNGDELMAANRFRADALILLGRKKEAQEALSKVLAASPGDEELRSKRLDRKQREEK
eukprot:452151-Ditylum_brightwellii.AAC.1